jgi:hypothetical protein
MRAKFTTLLVVGGLLASVLGFESADAACSRIVVSPPYTIRHYDVETVEGTWYASAHVWGYADGCIPDVIAFGIELTFEGSGWGQGYQEVTNQPNTGTVMTHTGGTFGAYVDLPCGEGNYQGVAASFNGGAPTGPKYGSKVYVEANDCPVVHIAPNHD